MAAKKIKKKTKEKIRQKTSIPFGRENYVFFLIGLLIIIIGYVFMAQGPADSFWSLTLAPILLVISYCIIIPISIIYKKKSTQKENTVETPPGG